MKRAHHPIESGDLVVILCGEMRGRIGKAMTRAGWDTVQVCGDSWTIQLRPDSIRHLLDTDRVRI